MEYITAVAGTPDNSTKNKPWPLELGITSPNMKIRIRMVLGVPPPFLGPVALFPPPLDPSFLSPAGGSQFLPAAAPYVTPAQISGALKLRQVHCRWMTWKHGRENKIISFHMGGDKSLFDLLITAFIPQQTSPRIIFFPIPFLFNSAIYSNWTKTSNPQINRLLLERLIHRDNR